jgi:hypothetical protein
MRSEGESERGSLPAVAGSRFVSSSQRQNKGSMKLQQTTTFAEGVVSNLPAFMYLILNRNIWKKAELSVQRMLYESLAKLVTTHEHATFNILRFREANVMEELLFMFQREAENLHHSLATALISVLRAIMNDPPCVEDFQKIFTYLVATHPPPGTRRPLVSGINRSVSSEGIPTTVRMRSSSKMHSSLRKPSLPTTMPVYPARHRGTQPEAVLQKGESDDESELEHEPRAIRVHVLQMILDTAVGSEAAAAALCGACTLQTLLSLLQHDDVETRIILMKILDVFLRSLPLRLAFEKMRGFTLVGDLLKTFPVTEELLGVVFCMLLGKPTHHYNAPNTGEGLCTPYCCTKRTL